MSRFEQEIHNHTAHLQLRGVHKRYGSVCALDDICLEIQRGEVFGIIGRSGAGKSSLLRLLNRLETTSNGQVIVDGRDITILNAQGLREFRRKVGMIFQHFNLLSSRTVAENVELPLVMAGIPKQERARRVEDLLNVVGLSERAGAYPAQLSGGQKQRVGIARALVLQPEILLCDEATSALDPESTKSILMLLRDINRRLGLTIILITHEMEVIRDLCDRVAVLERGRVVESGEVWEVFGAPKHEVSKVLLSASHPASESKKETRRYLDLHYTGVKGLQPNLMSISKVLGGDVYLHQSSIEQIQGRTLGYLTLAISSDLPTEHINALAASFADQVVWHDSP